MSIRFTGDEPSTTERIETGIYLFDRACADRRGNRGFPLRSIVEMYGPKGVGKTTFGTWLVSKAARALDTRIDYCDLEGQSRETLEDIMTNAGFDGEAKMVLMVKGRTPEKMIDQWVDNIFEDDAGMGVFDAIGAFTSTAEFNGKLTDKNVGEKPFVMGRVVGRCVRAINEAETARTILFLNHEHPQFNSMVRGGTTTGGGEKKKYLSHVRIRLQQGFLGKSTINFEEGYLLKGKVDNNRYGYDKRIFWPFILKGQGVHLGLTAMWECIATKIADLTADTIGLGTGVKLDGEKMGKIGDIIAERDKFNFLPFLNALKQADAEAATEDTEEETENETE